MKRQTVYLSRAFTGCKVREIVDYYNDLKKQLSHYGFDTIAPLTKDFLHSSKLDTIIQVVEGEDAPSYNCSKSIVRRDFYLVMQSDIVIVDLRFQDKVSIGAISELSWAYALDKHIIVVKEPHTFKSPFVEASACVLVETLEQAVDYLSVITLY